MMKKYNVNRGFDKTAFVSCLRSMGVDAYEVEDGIIFNANQYREKYSAATAPHMVYMNHRWVKALL